MLIKRVLTVLVAVPVVLGCLFSPWPNLFKSLILLAILLAFLEFYRLGNFTDIQKKLGLLLGGVHVTFLLFCPWTAELLLLEMVGLVIAVFLHYLLFHKELEGVGQRLGFMLLGLVYLGTMGSLMGLLRDFPDGPAWVLLLFAVTWFNDTFAYFVGHWWGKRKLAPLVSPGKTVEGVIGGYFGSLLGFFLIWHFFGLTLSLGEGMILVVLVSILGPAGDLSESLLKRSSGVKDSGNLIPGHGGLMDRLDALLFNVPVVYAFALWAN